MTKCHDLAVKSYAAFISNVGSPFAQNAKSLLQAEDWTGLVNLTIDPKDYGSAYSFHLDYVVKSWLSKADFLPTGINKKSVALGDFHKAETVCASTNEIFKLRASGTYSFRPEVERVLSRARSKIARLLFGFSPSKAINNSRYGPGATFLLKGGCATVDNKVLSTDVTPRALRYARLLIEGDHHRFSSITGHEVVGPFCVLKDLFSMQRGNKVTTVPKSAKTDRTIAIEPCMNLELQLGVGKFIRRRLLSLAGVDLNDQSHNQLGAKLAFQWGFATIDLKAASDTISRELVFDLLPIDFALFLDDIRSHEYLLEGEWTSSQKFSSMGNGFTFELESLIFWAICSSIDEYGWALVYGDDIVIDSQTVPLCIEVLNACGFTVNETKSFWSGNFFESCGMHFFKGKNVTPIYQKEAISDDSSRIRLANRIRRLAYLLGDGVGCDGVLHKSWSVVVPPKIRAVMPLTRQDGSLYEGDEGYALCRTELNEFLVQFKGRLPSLSFKPLSKRLLNDQPLLAYALRFGSTSFSDSGVPIRNRGKYYMRLRRRLYSDGFGSVPWF